MKFQLVSLRERQVSRDWTQQELAEFYRVESVLGAAGIAVEMDRGVTDEGDPWFVFCRPQSGDVIIHFARTEGVYLAASGALGHVLRGRDFRELVDAFIARQPLVMPGSQGQPGTVTLHPSALLSALVATALFILDQGHADAATLPPAAHSETPAETTPVNRFAALVNILLEPLRPDEHRDALLTIGAIVAGIAAVSLENAKEGTILFPAIEADSTVAQEAQALQDEERLANAGNLPLHKDAAIDNASVLTSDASQDSGADPAKLITEFQPVADAEIELVRTAERTGNLHQPGDQAPSMAHAELADDVSLPVFFQSMLSAQSSIELRKTGHAESPATAQGTPETNAVHTASDKAELASQDSIATALTKFMGASTLWHVSFVDVSSVPELASFDFAKFGGTEQSKPLTAMPVSGAAYVSGNTLSFTSGDAETPQTAEDKAMAAITFFAKTNPDFKVAQMGRDIILFDFEARPDHQISYDVHSWSLPDGSKVTIIGALPAEFLA